MSMYSYLSPRHAIIKFSFGVINSTNNMSKTEYG
jgi:hypothetical protein